ncbi:MAG: 1-phosphofructokinase family hexose kinase, partial [Clostridia bacterium]|nr:1-phosphofructokinase family hexose kinase [Clostridia bacterium]
MIITVTLNPALDKTVTIAGFKLDAVNRVSHARLDAGGKGVNVSKALQAWGRESTAMGFAGGSGGEMLLCELEAQGIPCSFVRVNGETRTNLKVFDPASHTYTDINEPGPVVPPGAAEDLFGRLAACIKPNDTVLFAGSSPQGIADDLPARWAQALSPKGARIVADLDGPRLKAMVESKPYLIKPNASELAELCGLADMRMESLAKAARNLVQKGVGRVAVSMGPKGALFVDKAGALLATGPRVDAVSSEKEKPR